jgi:hypothetical protein
MRKKCLLPLISIIMTILPVIMAILPAGAMAAQPAADGRYTIGVMLAGGSGRVTVGSPAELTIAGGAMTAVIIWSSPYYDFMLVDGTYYYPVNSEGNATFEIPVRHLDRDIAVSAETTAMSEPHVIDYTLRFDSSTLKPAAGGQQAAVMTAITASVVLAAIVLGIILAVRKRKSGKE